MSEFGVRFITMPILIAELIKYVELGIVIASTSGTLFMVNGNSPLPDETGRKRFTSKEAQHLYLGNICIPGNE